MRLVVGERVQCNFGRHRWYDGIVVAESAMGTPVFYSPEASNDHVGHDANRDGDRYGHWWLHGGDRNTEWRVHRGVPSQNGGANFIRED